MDFRVKYDFLRGESYVIKTIPFNNILENVEAYPGLYSWYIRPKPAREEEIRPIVHELLQQTKLKAELTGNLRLNYEGTLNKKKIDFEASNDEMLRAAFVLTPYPLYIGISIDLKKRLATHVKQLNEINLQDSLVSYKIPRELDSDEESSYFAARISKVFSNAGISALDSLYIRLYEYTVAGKTEILSNSEKKKIKLELEQVERISNSVFNPVFGRR